MLRQQICGRSSLASARATPILPARAVRARLFRRDGPVAVEEVAVDELNQPTKRQREQLKRTLQDLGFTEQAADILAFSKITSSNADLLIGDIRASFGIYQPPPPQGPVESVQSGVADLLERLRLPFLGLVLAAGLAAAFSQRESLGSLLPSSESVVNSVLYATDDFVELLSGLPGLGGAADALDEFLFNALQR